MPKSSSAKRVAVFSDRAWAETIADALGPEGGADVDRVQSVLSESGLAAGRPPSMRHQLKVSGIYFAGIKVVRSAESAEESVDSAVTAAIERVPFSFQHTFDRNFTAFATDGINDAGKSTILGVLLWGLRGTVPVPTLQGDIRENWLREAVVTLTLDGDTIAIQWRIDEGRPEGAIYVASAPVDLASLKGAGHETAVREWEAVNPDDMPVLWPGQELVAGLAASSGANLIAVFETPKEFEAAVAGVMMTRLDIEPVRVWAKRPNAVDQHDAGVVEHGWSTLSSALAITNPTSGSVMGEEVMVTQHLMGVFLGSTWSLPTVTARWQLKRAEREIAGVRRRAEDDKDARGANLEKLKSDLAARQVELDALGDVLAYIDVLAATENASRDAVAASKAQNLWLEAAAEYGQVEREIESTKRDLHALLEALATKRFWHSLRPSCCPRCDKEIQQKQWAREREGHCSLCDGEFIEVGAGDENQDEFAETLAGADAGDSEDGEDNEDEIVAVRAQLAELVSLREDASRRESEARATREAARETATESARALEEFDWQSAAERRRLEDIITALRGRIEEREAIDAAVTDPELEAQRFARSVFKSAEEYAKKERDREQHQTLEVVSAVITDLGQKFGVRNLISANLGANGHLPVVKGVKKDKFSDLPGGERLRLRIALVVGLLQAGAHTGTGRHPGLLVVDDLTSQEINHDDAAAMVRELVTIDDLQVITASTYAPTLAAAAGVAGDVVMPPDGGDVMF